MSRIKVKISQKTAIVDLAKDVEKIWKAGDGCPKHFHHIMTQFEKTVLVLYQKYRKGDQPGKSKKKKIQTPSKSPARRSVRQKSDDQHDHDPGTHQDQQDEVDQNRSYHQYIKEKGITRQEGGLDERSWMPAV